MTAPVRDIEVLELQAEVERLKVDLKKQRTARWFHAQAQIVFRQNLKLHMRNVTLERRMKRLEKKLSMR